MCEFFFFKGKKRMLKKYYWSDYTLTIKVLYFDLIWFNLNQLFSLLTGISVSSPTLSNNRSTPFKLDDILSLFVSLYWNVTMYTVPGHSDWE